MFVHLLPNFIAKKLPQSPWPHARRAIYTASTRHSTSRRRWPSVKAALGECLVFAGICIHILIICIQNWDKRLGDGHTEIYKNEAPLSPKSIEKHWLSAGPVNLKWASVEPTSSVSWVTLSRSVTNLGWRQTKRKLPVTMRREENSSNSSVFKKSVTMHWLLLSAFVWQ